MHIYLKNKHAKFHRNSIETTKLWSLLRGSPQKEKRKNKNNKISNDMRM